MKFLVMLVMALSLGACAAARDWIDTQTPLSVVEVTRLASCNTPGAEWQIHYFGDVASLEAWERMRGTELTNQDPAAEGPFVVAELGERNLDGYGLVVSSEAVVRGNDRLVLQSTQLYPRQIGGKATSSSPCVLVALPPRHYESVELYDQEGKRRARTKISTKKS